MASVQKFSFSVTPAEVVSPLGAIVEAMRSHSSGALYSFELPTATDRFLGESHPLRPAGNQKISDKIDYWGASTTAMIRDTAPADARRAHEGYNGGSNRQLLVGLGGAAPSYWDSVGQSWWHGAGATGSSDWTQGLMRYTMATDTFTHHIAPATGNSAQALWPGRGSAHNFSRSAFDPIRRVFYHTVGTHLDGRGTIYRVCYANVAQANTDPTDRSWLGALGASERYFGEWPVTRCDPNFGSGGSLIIIPFAGNTNCQILRFDVATGAYTAAAYTAAFPTPPAGNNPTNTEIRFPATVLFDGYVYCASIEQEGRQKFWRIPTTLGPIDKSLPDCPVAMDGSGFPTGQHTEFAVLGRKLYAFHADTSYDIQDGRAPDFDGGIWAYDVDTRRWSARLDDCWLRQLMGLTTVNNETHNFTVTSVPELGVFLIAVQTQNFETKAFVWKPPA